MIRKYENHFYHKTLQPYANRLRKEMAKQKPVCACLSADREIILRTGQLKGFQFRRQRPVLNYIADFHVYGTNADH